MFFTPTALVATHAQARPSISICGTNPSPIFIVDFPFLSMAAIMPFANHLSCGAAGGVSATAIRDNYHRYNDNKAVKALNTRIKNPMYKYNFLFLY